MTIQMNFIVYFLLTFAVVGHAQTNIEKVASIVQTIFPELTSKIQSSFTTFQAAKIASLANKLTNKESEENTHLRKHAVSKNDHEKFHKDGKKVQDQDDLKGKYIHQNKD